MWVARSEAEVSPAGKPRWLGSWNRRRRQQRHGWHRTFNGWRRPYGRVGRCRACGNGWRFGCDRGHDGLDHGHGSRWRNCGIDITTTGAYHRAWAVPQVLRRYRGTTMTTGGTVGTGGTTMTTGGIVGTGGTTSKLVKLCGTATADSEQFSTSRGNHPGNRRQRRRHDVTGCQMTGLSSRRLLSHSWLIHSLHLLA